MQSRSADSEFVGYSTLFFIIVPHPFCKFVQLIPLLWFFLWTKIRHSDTFVSITKKTVNGNPFHFFSRDSQKQLTFITQHVTMSTYVAQN
jgi:hypothetical protein